MEPLTWRDKLVYLFDGMMDMSAFLANMVIIACGLSYLIRTW